MQTFLYNLNTQKREGEIREGRYLVDGKPGVLPEFLVELEIVSLPKPSYNYETQTLEYRSYPDLNNFKWVEESYVRDLTSQEIEQRKPTLPSVTPRQLRLAIIKNGISLSQIDNLIEAIPDEKVKEAVKIEWEYAIEFERNHEFIDQFGKALGLTNEQIDDIFKLAYTL